MRQIILNNKRKLLPIDTKINSVVNEYQVYLDERKKCNKLRITCNINTLCSNVLYNNITEIVKDEGSDNVISLNFPTDIISVGEWGDKIIGKTFDAFKITQTLNTLNEAVRDTQLSKDSIGFKYHCGLDIFNNHIIRSKTFKIVGPDKSSSNKDFNTLSDMMRDYYGKQIEGYTTFKNKIPLHIYSYEDTLTFEDCVKQKLIEKDGWFGFNNVGKMSIYAEDGGIIDNYDYFNIINNKNSCEFIDLSPERDLFTFTPKYNQFRHRQEKNWNYCLTYPSSSITEGISFIEQSSNSLKIMSIDDTVKNKSGLKSIEICSVCKHGLKVNDYVNIYSHNFNQETQEYEDEIIIDNVSVTEIINDYVFLITYNDTKLISQWYTIDENDIYIKSDGKGQYADCITLQYTELNDELQPSLIDRYFIISSDRKTLVEGIINDNDEISMIEGSPYYYVYNNKVNIDKNMQHLSFKKLVNNYEVEYYVRIFSRLPNWTLFGKIPSKDELKSNPNLLNEYKKRKYEFNNSISNLSFSRNIYNDSIGSVIFTDDIYLDNLTDNLGRPVTDIYLTLIKNNKGYKQWYGKYVEHLQKNTKEAYKVNLNNSNIEYSHCFGKVSCGFELSLPSLINKDYNNVRCINNIENTSNTNGLLTDLINERSSDAEKLSIYDEICYNDEYDIDGETVLYDGDINFYGDLCSYSKYNCQEEIIQNIDYRFNTAQRELVSGDYAYPYMQKLFYEEIEYDDYDEQEFKITTSSYIDGHMRKEGYFYNPHFRIPIKTFDNNIQTRYPNFLHVRDIINDTNFNDYKSIEDYIDNQTVETKHYELFTLESTNFKLNDVIMVYSVEKQKLYNGVIYEIVSSTRFKIAIECEIGELNIDSSNKNSYRFFQKDETIPEYAHIVLDGTCRFYWREVIQNGFNNLNDITVYPFTNNAFNINKTFNLYLKRQDYDGLVNMRETYFPNEPEPKNQENSYSKENNYYNEKDIVC